MTGEDIDIAPAPATTVLVGDIEPLLAEVRRVAAAVPGFRLLDGGRSAAGGLEVVGVERPALLLLVSPLSDSPTEEFIARAKARSPSTRVVMIADRPEFTGYATANRQGADGFISARSLSRDLLRALTGYSSYAGTWGRRFSPWKQG